MTTFEQALEMLGEDELRSASRLSDHLSRQDAEFLANLVALRIGSGLKQTDLAIAWGRHKTSVSQFEQPGNDPRLSTVRRYAASIGARYVHMVYTDVSIDVCRRESTIWGVDATDETTQPDMIPAPVLRIA